MSQHVYLYNQDEIDSSDCDGLLLTECRHEFPLLLKPLFASQAQIGNNSYSRPSVKTGLYAEAAGGVEALRRFYDFIERHADSLLDDVEAFRRARERIFDFLDSRVDHAWFHIDACGVFSIQDEPHKQQAKALLADINQVNACIREAIESDNPALLDACPGVRELLNNPNYDYGRELFGAMLPSCEDGEEFVEIFCKKGLYGLRTSNGGVLIAPRYQVFEDFDWQNDLACVALDGRYGYVNQRGHEVIACQFEAASGFVGDYASVCEGGKYGLIDTQGQRVVPCQFDEVEPLNYGGEYWKARQGGLLGVIVPQGRWVLPLRYREICGHGGYCSVQLESGARHVLTSSFHDLGPMDPDDIETVSTRKWLAYVICRRDEKKKYYRVVDQGGQALLPGEFQSLQYLSDHAVWLVRTGRKYGLYRHDEQRWLLPCSYARIEPESGRYCRVKEGRRWGLYRCDDQPDWVMTPRFEELWQLQEGLFQTCEEGRWGIIDGQGQWLRQPHDQTWASTRLSRDGALAVVFSEGRAWQLYKDGDCQPLAAEQAMHLLKLYADDCLNEIQLACLQGSAGDLLLAWEAHCQGQAALEEKDYATARPLLQRAVDLGHASAMNDLGCLLQDADQNAEGALELFHRASAAGLAMAAHNLGNCYACGRGTAVDLAKARYFFELAIGRAHRPAHYRLARLLIDQDELEPALEHFLAAWRYGNQDESASYLGWLYEQRGDYAQAQRYYFHAVGVGDRYAHWRMGRIHLYGRGVPVNRHKAAEYLRIACEKQYEDAYPDMAELLLGDDATQEQAWQWLHKAVELGVPCPKHLLDYYRKPSLFQRFLDRLR